MNSYPNSAPSATQERVLYISNFNTLHDDTNLDQKQLKHYNDQDTDDGSTILEYEVLSDEFAVDSNDEYSNSASTILPTNKTPPQWTRDTINYLIGTYKRLARDEVCGITNFGSTVIWTEVSRKLMQRGFTYTPEQCRTKWSMLKKLYQHIRNETQVQKFEFIEAIHDYYKNPKIERLLAEARKNEILTHRRPKRTRDKNKSSMVGTEISKFDAFDNFTLKFDPDECKSASQSGVRDFSSHQYPNDATQEDTESVSFKLEIETDTCEILSDICQGESETAKEYQEEVASDYKITSVNEHSHFIEEFKKIVESQEQRRDERHTEKLRMFRDYNERLLAQQEVAIMLHKQLMERLIANL